MKRCHFGAREADQPSPPEWLAPPTSSRKLIDRLPYPVVDALHEEAA